MSVNFLDPGEGSETDEIVDSQTEDGSFDYGDD